MTRAYSLQKSIFTNSILKKLEDLKYLMILDVNLIAYRRVCCRAVALNYSISLLYCVRVREKIDLSGRAVSFWRVLMAYSLN